MRQRPSGIFMPVTEGTTARCPNGHSISLSGHRGTARIKTMPAGLYTEPWDARDESICVGGFWDKCICGVRYVVVIEGPARWVGFECRWCGCVRQALGIEARCS